MSHDHVTPVTSEAMPDPWVVTEFLRLSPVHRAFVKSYLTSAGGNGTMAASACGYGGKYPRKYASDVLKREPVKAAIAACTPVLHALERYEIRNPPVLTEAEALAPVKGKSKYGPPRWKRRDLVAWCEKVSEGIDPDFVALHATRPCPENGDCLGCRQPVIPWPIRQNAARMLKELRGWDHERAQRVVHTHKGKVLHTPVVSAGGKVLNPVHSYVQSLPDSELYNQLEAAKSRNTIKVPALQPATSAAEIKPEPEAVTDAETE